ncbi:polysaccharide lyase family 7 protein [Streptomyces sp. NBC_00820]|uniref:polysaccharide lyase family 7 protein n=1 Tax=Streptomyces sp. NBC_00820 TaxID=2975842 RepID=UPI002ED4F473|nr:polysaccharide lyase family 7 protein [Streptomyces sp. NBC_00820]
MGERRADLAGPRVRCARTSVYEAKYVVSDGQIKAYYNGTLEATIAYTGSGNYFKAGAYVQANCTNSSPCSSTNYGETNAYSVTVSHT